MTTRARLIHRLADGGWYRGPELARELGISRAAVSKALKGLSEAGFPVQSGRAGHRIPVEAFPPNAQRIVRGLERGARDCLTGLQTLYRTDSTNSWLLRRGGPDRVGKSRVCIAAQQTGGRGRLGRVWDSPAGSGLYLSLDLIRLAPPEPALPLAVGVMAAEAMEAVSPGVEVALKWPNDILLGSQLKTGGILMESRGEYGGHWHLVIGLGLNLRGSAHEGRTSLAASGVTAPAREDLSIELLNRLLVGCAEASANPQPWLDAWERRDGYRGQRVQVTGPQGVRHGIAAGIDQDGAMLLQAGNGIERITGGDVSLRGA